MICNLSLFVAVAVFAACLVSFHSNPTSAAVIDAGATPPTGKLKDTVLANKTQQHR